ncbi:MAG: hypothetical protein JWN41_1095 [Thermoleophilia bacterium]|nr:hypothetical protein [Thermoleophilia bacterium]
MTSSAYNSPSPLAGLVDETRVGSAGGQTLTGIAGIVLAILLVAGQISLATTKGISQHLHASVAHMAAGNDVMESVISRAVPSTAMERVLAQQADTLGNVRDSMVRTNAQLGEIGATTRKLSTATDTMSATSARLAVDVAKTDRNTGAINVQLGTLPGATKATGASLSSINGDMRDLNGELATISHKLVKYGLPRARNARHAP